MDKILEVKKLRISFRTTSGTLKAVRNISFDLERGKTLAIVGESGSGKSVTSKAIIGILAGNSIVEGGEILYDGHDLLRIPEEEMQHIRGDKISMIFQDPLSSLNPIVKIGKQITEAMLLKNKTSRREAKKEFSEKLKLLDAFMLKAVPERADDVKRVSAAFEKLTGEASRLEQDYNNARTAAEELISAMEDAAFKISKKQDLDLKTLLKEWAKKLPRVENEFLTGNAKLNGIADELEACAKKVRPHISKNEPDSAEMASVNQAIGRALSQLKKLESAETPDFIREAGSRSGSGSGVTEDFLSFAEEGVRLSAEDSLKAKAGVLGELKKARDYYSGDFERKEGLERCRQLSDMVSASIDRLETVKDSAAYAFSVSLRSAIEHYFDDQKHNVKEEARFARQTKKRERLVAKGRHVDWKVVPKNIYAVEDLRANILTVLDRVTERYEAVLANPDADYAARASRLMTWLRGRMSASVYRITPTMAKEKAIKLMEEVGIHEPRTRYYQYPFEFSGGMRQRIVIAIALAADPDILICDEPTTALDVTIQAQILELINRLKVERNLSVIFITHDLGVVANMADDIAVMYAGKIIEYGTADDIFYDPRHPYTWALLASMPDLDTTEKLDAIPGTPPNMIYPPVGDAFADRNRYALKIDYEMEPPMFTVSETHRAATWLLHPDAPKVEPPKIIVDRIARMKKAGGETDA